MPRRQIESPRQLPPDAHVVEWIYENGRTRLNVRRRGGRHEVWTIVPRRRRDPQQRQEGGERDAG